MDKRFLGILGVIIIVFIGVFAISQKSDNNSSGSNNSGSQTTNHVEGQNQKGVTLVEYGDYQCPICEAYYLPLKQAVAQYINDIHFQFRNLPLTAIHQNAFAGARAAEAASLQGKFWQMHDKLYDNQNAWTSSSSPLDLFSQYAQQIGLNVTQFKTDYASSKVNDAINADLAAFDKTGKDKATPTFFLDGVYLPNTGLADPQTGAPSADKIGAAIKAEIDKKNSGSSSPNNSNSNNTGNPY
ncbi:DsbA family protein [Candidatus Saccharibacteria bacterium]|nr:DsbA family protein [Candidatus Saccharibacteria bacterium]